MEWHNWLSIALGVVGVFFIASMWISFLKSRQSLYISVGFVMVLAAIILAVIPFTKSVNTDTSGPGLPELAITSPVANATVPQQITVTGYSKNQIPTWMHLYVVVELDNKWWPQVSEITATYNDSSGFYEFSVPVQVGTATDASITFNIRVALVDGIADDYFKDWLTQYNGGGVVDPIISQAFETNVIKSVAISVTRE